MDKGKSWVNARITVLVPLAAVTVEATEAAKLTKAEAVYDDLIADLPEVWHEFVDEVTFEEVTDGE